MIEQFWTICTAFITIIFASCGASWVVNNHKDTMQEKYKDEIKEISSTIYSSKILPYVIKILEESNTQKQAVEKITYEEILSEEKYMGYIKNITEAENIISQFKYKYGYLQQKLTDLSSSLLRNGIWFSIFGIYYLFEINLYFNGYGEFIFIILLMIALFILFEVGNNYNEYRDTKQELSEMYNEIVLEI